MEGVACSPRTEVVAGGVVTRRHIANCRAIGGTRAAGTGEPIPPLVKGKGCCGQKFTRRIPLFVLLARQPLLDPGRMHLALLEIRLVDEAAKEFPIGYDSQHGHPPERLPHPGDGRRPVLGEADDLREKGIVMEAHRIAFGEARVDAQAGPGGRDEAEETAPCREKAPRWVFRLEPAFDRVSPRSDVFLAKGQRLARGDANLPAHKIESRDEFRDGMLDLKAGVHL